MLFSYIILQNNPVFITYLSEWNNKMSAHQLEHTNKLCVVHKNLCILGPCTKQFDAFIKCYAKGQKIILLGHCNNITEIKKSCPIQRKHRSRSKMWKPKKIDTWLYWEFFFSLQSLVFHVCADVRWILIRLYHTLSLVQLFAF